MGALLLGFLLVVIVFFDVLFLKASLQPSNLAQHLGRPADYQTISLLPAHHEKTRVAHGFSDLGATAWQSEPTRHFVARALRSGDSIFWNPYSAAGSLGPETLVDIKSSPHTLLGGLVFNASAASFDLGLLLIFALSCSAMLLIGRQYLGMSYNASIMLSIGFLLGGYATPNFNSQNGQSYFLAPLAMLALFHFYHRPSAKSWVLSLFAQALLLLVTLLPVSIIVMVTIHVIALGWALGQQPDSRLAVLKLATLQFFSPLLALLLIAPIWFPILSYLLDGTLFESYSARTMNFYDWDNLLNLFTPRHYWENYNGIRPMQQLKEADVKAGIAVLPHLGIGAIFAVFSTILAKQKRTLAIFCLLLVLLAYSRCFGYPPFAWMEDFPGVGIFGRQYWGAMTSLAFAMLLGLSFHRLENERPHLAGLAAAILMFCMAFWGLYEKLGWPSEQPWQGYLTITLSLVVINLLVILGLIFKPGTWPRKPFTALLAVLVTAELFYYVNHLRPERYDVKEHPPEFVQFLQDNLQGQRVFSIGDRNVLTPEFGAMYGLRQISTKNSSLLPWYRDFYLSAFGSDWPNFLQLGYRSWAKNKTLVPPDGEELLNTNALDMLEVKYVVLPSRAEHYKNFLSSKGYQLVWKNRATLVYENPQPLPGARLLRKFREDEKAPVSLREETEQTVTSTDPELLALANNLGNDSSGDSIEKVEFLNNRVSYQITAASPAVLVTSEVWHPDWKATINGKPANVYRVNGAFRGVWVPGGNHMVSFSYRPRLLTAGIITSCLFLLFCLGLVIWETRRGFGYNSQHNS